METESVLPKFNLFPRLVRVGRFIGEMVRPVHQLATHGDHDFARGSGPALDRELYADPLDHLQERTNRWDSEGRYFED